MRARALPFLCVVLLPLLAPACSDQDCDSRSGGRGAPGEETSEELVEKVLDGDTIDLEGGERIRYLGVCAPESSEPYGPASTRLHEELVAEQRVRVYPGAERSCRTDNWGRTLAQVTVGDLWVNFELIRSGAACVHRGYTECLEPSELQLFTAAEQDARTAVDAEGRPEPRGLWGVTGYCPCDR